MGISYALFILLTLAMANSDIPTCLPACSSSQACIRTEIEKSAVCKSIPALAPLENLTLPFDPNKEVYCTHSAGIGSHSWSNAYYSIDLASPYDRPALTIKAAADGKAFVFLGEDGKPCSRPSGTARKAESSPCGKAWGNHIKILHDGGYYSFYVHLDRVLITNGTNVKRGQAIGIEGWTGAAGHRHLHWSVQKLPGNNASEWEKRISWAGESVPFKFSAYVNGKLTTVDTRTFECAHSRIGDVPSSQQPKLKATELLGSY